MKNRQHAPPRLFHRFFRWFCKPKMRAYIEGDLIEIYSERVNDLGERKADILFIIDVILLFRPAIIRDVEPSQNSNNYDMFRNYLKVATRNILKDKVYSFINVGGLCAGILVAGLISLWVYDELTMNRYHQNYDRIAQVMQHASISGNVATFSSLPMPTAAAIRSGYSEDFEYVAATWTGETIMAHGEKVFKKVGSFAEAPLPEILTLDMISGGRSALNDPSAILLSESLARSFFGQTDPVNQEIRLNNTSSLQVKGVYRDLPPNSSFSRMAFIAPSGLLFANGQAMDNWASSSFHIFAQLNPNSDITKASEKIKDIYYVHSQDATRPLLFLNPMSRWHLYEFKNGISVNGRMQFVWLFGIIGSFVLALACINFMNLSTARSEKRAKEVGIRKAIGSLKKQLINQFLTESLLVVTIAFIFAAILAKLTLSWFNDLSGKELDLPWDNPFLWLIAAGFICFVSVLAGSYPAFYLSSFQPISVLKGSFKAGSFASVPRKILVVLQFTVSAMLIIGTLIVHHQIQFAKSRPVGYTRDGLITVPLINNQVQSRYETFRLDLLKTNSVINVSQSSSPTTGIWSSADNLEWKGKDPNSQALFGTISIDPDFGDVVCWEIKAGRNFSRELSSDSQAFIFNNAAILQMGLKNPVGETVKWHGKDWNIIGVVEDMVMTSPFGTVMPTVFMIDNQQRPFNVINIKLNRQTDTQEALSKVEAVFKKYASDTPFDYKFADQEYALKFVSEERIGKLASAFATLAIMISCLGIFGLSSFVAEQRTKEIGIRKVLGASVSDLWQMLSKEFVVLVVISCFIAIPAAWYFMHGWIQRYEYHTGISWLLFLITAVGSLAVTILTISYHAVKAALTNPVNSLRSE